MKPDVKLDTLIDDCILKIVDYLSPVDVVNLASSCTRFFEFARSNIFSKFVKVQLDSKYCKKIEGKTITNEILETMMMVFGATVEHIELNCLVFACSYLKIVLEKCPRLHTLNIKQHVFTKEEIETISNVSTNIRVLILNSCKNVKAFHTLPIFPKLREIKLRWTITTPDELLLRHDVLPNLTELELVDFNFKSTSELKSNFELMGLNMRSLKLIGGEYDSIFREIAPLIIMKLKNIESFTICISDVSSLLCLTELNHLKYLSISGICCCVNLTELLNRLSARGILEALKLDGGTYMNDFPQFQKLRILRILRLNMCNGSSVNLIKACVIPLITHLWIGSMRDMTDDMLVALYAFKKSLIELRVSNEKRLITFSAIQQIIDYLRYRGADRPHLKLTIQPFELSLAEVISYLYNTRKLNFQSFFFFYIQEKILSFNRHLITVTAVPKSSVRYDERSEDSD